MNIASKLVGVAFLILLLLCSQVMAGSGAAERQWKKEVEIIENVPNATLNGFFVIRIFSGLMPLPNRYVQTITSSKLSTFSSDVVYGVWRSSVGNLLAGSYDEFIKRYAGKYKHRKYETLHKYGLSVVIYSPPDGIRELRSIRTVLINDGVQFILITDENSELWRVMLKAYGELNGISE